MMRTRGLAALLVVWSIGCLRGEAPSPEAMDTGEASAADDAGEESDAGSYGIEAASPSTAVMPPLELPGDACVPVPPEGDATPRAVVSPEGSPQQLVAHIVDLEERLQEADPEDQPALLYELGAVKSGLAIWFGSPIVAFARMRPDFGFNEIAGEFIYSGADYRTIIERFPDHELADDAAYALTQRPPFGECEGWIACYMGRDWVRLQPFLREFPDSELAPRVVRSALESFERVPPATDLRVSAEYRTPSDFRYLAESLDSVGGESPLAVGGPLSERAAEIWTQFGEYDRARTAVVSILRRRAPTEVGRCLVARSGALPTRWVRLGAVERDASAATLRWSWEGPPPDSALVHRSQAPTELGEIVGRPPPGVTTWSDAAVLDVDVSWYRVVIYLDDELLGSNPAALERGR